MIPSAAHTKALLSRQLASKQSVDLNTVRRNIALSVLIPAYSAVLDQRENDQSPIYDTPFVSPNHTLRPCWHHWAKRKGKGNKPEVRSRRSEIGFATAASRSDRKRSAYPASSLIISAL